jgi:hypothetical protein
MLEAVSEEQIDEFIRLAAPVLRQIHLRDRSRALLKETIMQTYRHLGPTKSGISVSAPCVLRILLSNQATGNTGEVSRHDSRKRWDSWN